MASPSDPETYAVRDRRWWTNPDADAAEPAAPSQPTRLAALEADVAERDRRLTELATQVRQSQQELEQAKVRIERDSRREIERRMRAVVGGWLSALDDL